MTRIFFTLLTALAVQQALAAPVSSSAVAPHPGPPIHSPHPHPHSRPHSRRPRPTGHPGGPHSPPHQSHTGHPMPPWHHPATETPPLLPTPTVIPAAAIRQETSSPPLTLPTLPPRPTETRTHDHWPHGPNGTGYPHPSHPTLPPFKSHTGFPPHPNHSMRRRPTHPGLPHQPTHPGLPHRPTHTGPPHHPTGTWPPHSRSRARHSHPTEAPTWRPALTPPFGPQPTTSITMTLEDVE